MPTKDALNELLSEIIVAPEYAGGDKLAPDDSPREELESPIEERDGLHVAEEGVAETGDIEPLDVPEVPDYGEVEVMEDWASMGEAPPDEQVPLNPTSPENLEAPRNKSVITFGSPVQRREMRQAPARQEYKEKVQERRKRRIERRQKLHTPQSPPDPPSIPSRVESGSKEGMDPPFSSAESEAAEGFPYPEGGYKSPLEIPRGPTPEPPRGFMSEDPHGLHERHWESGVEGQASHSINTFQKRVIEDQRDTQLFQDRVYEDIAKFHETVAKDTAEAYLRIHWLTQAYEMNINTLTDSNI